MLAEMREGICLRARDCRDATCRKCAGCRAAKRAKEVERVVGSWKHFQFWTLTADASAFGERQGDFFRHLLKVRAVGETMKIMQRLGWVGRWCVAKEFHKSGMIHFHLIVEAVKGFIPHHRFDEAWNRDRNRPEWAGPVGVFEGEGPKQGQERPVVGFVQFEVPKGEKAVVRYICGYLAQAGKNPEPQWFRDYRDGKLDGKVHNALLFSASRGFFEGVREPKPRKERIGPARCNVRRCVEERHERCRKEADIMKRTQLVINGKVEWSGYKYLGTLKGERGYGEAVWALFGELAGVEGLDHRAGCWITEDQLAYLRHSADFEDSWAGGGRAARPREGLPDDEPPDDQEGLAPSEKIGDHWDAWLADLGKK